MKNIPEITRIRAALVADLKGWGNINTAWVTQLDDDGNEGLSIVGAVIDGEMYPVIEIDTAQYYAEDSGPKLAEFYAACNSAAMTAVLSHIDAQQAEIESLKSENARLLSDVTRPESLDVGLMRAEIERLSKDAARYQWLRDGGIYILPYEDHGAGPEFDLSDASVDAAMKETP